MIATTAYILISTLFAMGGATQSMGIFADKQSCESAAIRQEFVYKDMYLNGKWNLTCHPYQLNEIKK